MRTVSSNGPKAENGLEEKQYFSIEGYLTYIPVLAAILALSIDVGFFYTFEMSFFTFFSLSEHILFAVEFLPFAIIILFAATIFLPLMTIQPKTNKQFKSRAQDRPWHRIAAITLIVVLLIVLLLAGLYMVIGIVSQLLSLDAPSRSAFILLLIGVIAPIVASYLFVAPPRFRQLQVAASFAVGCLLVSFVIGLLWGVNLRNSNRTSVLSLKDNRGAIRGAIIRSGERGVLIYESASKRVLFEPWEFVISIEASAAEL